MKLIRLEISREVIEYIIGFVAIVAFYIWLYDTLSPGWRFFGMVLISLIVGVVVQFSIMFFSKRRLEKLDKIGTANMCRTLGVSPDSTNEDDVARCWKYLIDRYSPELLVNRLSDAIGTLTNIASSVLSVGITLWYFGMVIYFAWNQYYGDHILLWLPLMSHIAMSLCILTISVATRIILNRLPGESKAFNKKYDSLIAADAFVASDRFRVERLQKDNQ